MESQGNSSMSHKTSLRIAGFWRRLFAFLADSMVLAIVGHMLGLAMFERLAGMHGYELLIGFIVTLAYFGVGNSRVTAGRTLGKRLLGIRVVDACGDALSLPRSIFRWAVLGVPYFAAGLVLMWATRSLWLMCVSSLFVFSPAAVTTYLYIFDRRTRRVLHDRWLGSYVVRDPCRAAASAFPRSRAGHDVMAALVAIMAAAAPVLLGRTFLGTDMQRLFAVTQAMRARTDLNMTQLSFSSEKFNGQASQRVVSATFRLANSRIDDGDYARSIARSIILVDPHPDKDETIAVMLGYGFDLGIASRWSWHSYRFKTGELL